MINQYWAAWALGMMLPFGLKLGHYLFQHTGGTKADFVKALVTFVFGDTTASLKTTLNVSGELVLGAVYIDKLPMPYMSTIDLPLHWAAAFFFALMAELIVPLIVDGIVEWFKSRVKRWAGN